MIRKGKHFKEAIKKMAENKNNEPLFASRIAPSWQVGTSWQHNCILQQIKQNSSIYIYIQIN